jgi:hypothetical protein
VGNDVTGRPIKRTESKTGYRLGDARGAHDADRGKGTPQVMRDQGKYNPVLGEWVQPPANPNRADREAEFYKSFYNRRRPISAYHTSKTTGVFDPIKDRWIVPPLDRKVHFGHTYSPVKKTAS